MKSRLERWFAHLRRRGARHWLTALGIVLGLYLANPYIEKYFGVKYLDTWLFQTLSQLSTRALQPHSVTLVLIGDDDYWLGPLAGRAPLKRDYLAKLVDVLDQSTASVLAFDIDLRSPDPKAVRIAPDYKLETDELMAAIIRAARHHKIVLPKSIWFDQRGHYVLEPDIYEAYSICTAPVAPAQTSHSNISCGFTGLPTDMRLVPGSIPLGRGGQLDSFALAVARGVSPESAEAATGMNFGSFLPFKAWSDAGLVMDAGRLLQAPETNLKRISSDIVIVGGNWHSMAAGRGTPIDMHGTPVGSLNGSVIHANFVEAILNKRLYVPTAEWLPKACEILFAVIAAIIFSFEHSALTKLAALAVVSTVLVSVQWLLLHSIGVFFNAFVPMFGLWLHSMVERLIGEPE